MKRYSLPFPLAICLLFLLSSTQMVFSQSKKEWIIVIDPGHGGNDPGAIAGTYKEKDITLAIALKLGRQLAALEKTKVIYTRNIDTTVALYKRPQKANEYKADLFISIHCNSVESSKPYGAETWVMGLHRSKANLEVARAENSVILLEDDYKIRYDGFDPNSPEADIIFSLYQNAYLEQSVDIATILQKELRLNSQRFDRGVKQAGFLVLYKINMPGILVEAGFISNENERKFLTSDAGQNSISISMYNAVVKYREKIEGTKVAVSTSDRSSDTKQQPKTTDTTETRQTPNDLKADNKKGATNQTNNKPVETIRQDTPAVSSDELYYSVQFLTTAKKRELNDPAFANLKDVHVYSQDGSYKYVSGYFKSVDQAIELKNEMQKGAFPDAFVVAFHKGKRITLSEAAQLLKK